MSIRSPFRPARSRIRRIGVVTVIAAGLSATGAGVVVTSSVSAAPSAPSTRAVTLSQVVGLRYGAVGEPVRQVQQALVRVGVGVRHGVDGVFGSATRASVKAWQGHKGLAVTGVVDQATGRSLGFADPAQAGSNTGGSTSSAAPVVGNRGAAVARLQLALINHGYVPTGGVDGLFGAATTDALKRFQRAKGLAVTGLADAATMQALALSGSAPQNPGTSAPANPAPSVLQRGARGAAVKTLQQQLIAKGITVPGGADGIFGPGTEGALKTFQRQAGVPVTGKLDAATKQALAKPSSGANAPKPNPPSSGGVSSYVGLKLGSSGQQVLDMQRALMRFGWVIRGGADGYFGVTTQSVLKAFQRVNGAAQTGVLDAGSAQVLGLGGGAPNPTVPVSPATPGTTANGFAAYDEHGPRVVALQQALIRAGMTLKGGADGIFGSATAGAIMNFQRAKGLPVTGKVDATTAQRLGLAAMNPPAPPAAPSVRLEAKPLQGPCYYGDTWGFARGGGRSHLGVDILAAEGNQLYAVATGRISQIYVDRPGSLSGNGLKITRPDGTYFFYGHLSKLAPGMAVGTPVTAGQLVGYVGKTGNTVVPHLHLEIHPGGGAAVNPYPIVKAFGAC